MFNETTQDTSPNVGSVPARDRRTSGLADDFIDWSQIIDRGLTQAPAIINAARGNQFPNYRTSNPSGVGGSGSTLIGPNGLSSSGGFQVSTNTLVIGGLIIALILLTRGKK